MGFRTVVLGMLLLGFGGYMVASHKENPTQPKKVYGLDPLQDVLGDGVGSALHWAVFVVVPFGAGWLCARCRIGVRSTRGAQPCIRTER